jgi:hypothetical protein
VAHASATSGNIGPAVSGARGSLRRATLPGDEHRVVSARAIRGRAQSGTALRHRDTPAPYPGGSRGLPPPLLDNAVVGTTCSRVEHIPCI